jgi:hypothetical protein
MRDLQSLGKRLVGGWTTEGTHPGLPGTVIHGSSEIEWLENDAQVGVSVAHIRGRFNASRASSVEP